MAVLFQVINKQDGEPVALHTFDKICCNVSKHPVSEAINCYLYQDFTGCAKHLYDRESGGVQTILVQDMLELLEDWGCGSNTLNNIKIIDRKFKLIAWEK